jgi:hypothetical protein
VRYEFSGPAAAGWYAPFVPDGRGFLASRLFGQGLALWPTDHVATEHRRAPEPKATLESLPLAPAEAAASAAGDVALASAEGEVALARFEGRAPALAKLPGVGPSTVAFTPAGGHLVALRGGRLFAWATRPLSVPALPLPPAPPATPAQPTPAKRP